MFIMFQLSLSVLGEKMDDLEYFDLEKYIYGLFAELIEEEMNLLRKTNIISFYMIFMEIFN